MKGVTPLDAWVARALGLLATGILIAFLAPAGQALAAPETIALNGDAATGYPTSGTATVYADGFSLAYVSGNPRWQTVTVVDSATGQVVAQCPGPNCAVTAGNGMYIQDATISGLQPGVTYSVSIFEIEDIMQSLYAFEDLAPDLTTQDPVGRLAMSGPTGYPPKSPYQLNLTLSADTIEPSLTWTVAQAQLGPGGAPIPFTACPAGARLSGGVCLYALTVASGGTATLTTTNQQSGGPGYVYRYTATAAGYSTNAVLFANAPTFFVHRRTRGLFVTWPDEGNGATYDVFGGPGSAGCSQSTFNDPLPAGTTQLAVGGLTPNTQYAVCMWAAIPNQPVTPGGWNPTWWVAGGDGNGSGMWYTLPDVPGEAAVGGLLAAYYDVPALSVGMAGPATSLFGNGASYTEVQGPIDFAASCNCAASWPYAGHGGPMPVGTAGGGTAQGFAAKFLGWLHAPATGAYDIGCRADDACQVWVNGAIVVDGMSGGGPYPDYYGACNACSGVSGSIVLTAGDWYPVEVDYTQGRGGASLAFYWTPPGGAQADVPAADLAYPVLAGAQGGSQGNATISWASNGNPAGSTYQLERYVLSPSGGASDGTVLYLGPGTSYTTTDLQPGELTAYFARAASGDGFWTPYATEPGGGGYLYADTPAPTVAVPSSSASLTVTWPDVGGGAHYAVIWSSQPDFGTVDESGDLGSGVTTYVIAGLAPNTAYYVALNAWVPELSGVGDQICTGGAGGGCWWADAGGGQWTLANPPASLQVSGAGSALTLSWGGGGNPAGTSYRWSVGPLDSGTAGASGVTAALQAVAAGLSCQTDYTGSVLAVNGAGVAGTAVSAAAETGICPPSPQVGLSIDNGLAQTSSTSVTLDVTATDVNYTQAELRMRVSDDGSTWSAWGPYAATASWMIDGTAGPNTVYVQVEDPDGGVGSATATITYDSSLSVVAGSQGGQCVYRGMQALCVASPVITAAFAMPAGSVSMEISFDNTSWSAPQDATGTVDLVLPTGDGLKAVFARYFDRRDIATAAGPDYFVLETTPPSVEASWLEGAAVTDAGAATLMVRASDGVMPSTSLNAVVAGAASWSGPLPASGQIPLTLSGSGYVTVTVTVTDPAGNAASAEAGIYNAG